MSLRGVTVALGDRAILRGVDLDVGPGVTIVRGANGAGKTTLLRAIAGLVPTSVGRVRVSGSLLYLGHRPMLLRGLSARENLAFFTAFRGASGGAVDAALARWGLRHDADRPVERLSAGQRRRAALARLDAEPAAVALMDEPFAELDDEAAALLRASIESARSGGRAVLLATHGHAEFDAIAAARYRIDAGSLVSA